MERDLEQQRHEEAIEPVRPGFKGAAEPVVPPARVATPRFGALLAGGVLAVLVAVAAFVFFALPRWVAPAPDAAAPGRVQTVTVPEEPPEPALGEEEIAALRERADGQLGDLLSQQQRLEALSAESWAGEDWSRYEALAREGDDAYLAEDLESAVDAYAAALDLGVALLERSDAIRDSALAAGRRAIDAGNAELAIEQFDLVLSIEPDHADARVGRERAEKLPDVLELVRRAAGEAAEGRLDEAAESYRAALEIDREWPAAKRGLADVERRIANARYDALMSRGMQALAEERYGDAEQAFGDALGMRPGSDEARDGLMQAEQGAKLDQIALAEARALAFERRELWAQAIAQYEDALATDATLAFAREGLDRARNRADLDAKLVNLLDNPGLLFRDAVLADTEALIVEAEETLAAAQAQVGEQPRLSGQIARLEEMVHVAKTPIPVQLVSDGVTEVTVYRVGRLGAFESHELELRPGNYTAVGSRDGYRDVRRTFTVLPGRELEPVTVICVDTI